MNLEQLARDISSLSTEEVDYLSSQVSWFVGTEQQRIKTTSIKAAGIAEVLKDIEDEEVKDKLCNLIYAEGQYKAGVKPKSNPGGSPNDDDAGGEG